MYRRAELASGELGESRADYVRRRIELPSGEFSLRILAHPRPSQYSREWTCLAVPYE